MYLLEEVQCSYLGKFLCTLKVLNILLKGSLKVLSNESKLEMYKLVMPGVCYVVDYVQVFI